MPSVTRGFEFAYNLNGGNDVPVPTVIPVGGGTALVPGDLLALESGNLIKATTTTTTVVAVMAGSVTASSSAGDPGTIYVLRPGQVWRCSSDAGTISVAVGGGISIADENTLDANAGAGSIIMRVVKKLDSNNTSILDTSSNAIGYVTFPGTVLAF
jgi:hypothetical protein